MVATVCGHRSSVTQSAQTINLAACIIAFSAGLRMWLVRCKCSYPCLSMAQSQMHLTISMHTQEHGIKQVLRVVLWSCCAVMAAALFLDRATGQEQIEAAQCAAQGQDTAER